MRILDKYMLREFIGPFLFGVAAFTSIFIGADLLFRIAQLMTTYGASVWAVTKVFVLALPKIVVYTFPMSVLLGALMAVARISGSSELIVMRAAGQPFLRLVMPIFILAFFISMGTILFNEYVVPASTEAYRRTIDYEIKGNVRPKMQDHIVLKHVEGGRIKHLLYARHYNPETEELQAVTIQEFNEDQLVRVENAPRAIWSGMQWVLDTGTIYDLGAGTGVERVLHFDRQVLPFYDTPAQVGKSKKDAEAMTIRELRQEIRAYEGANTDATSLVMEMHRRFSLPLASFFFALLGAPLGIQRQRSSSSLGFGISVIVIFVYYALMTFGSALGEGQAVSPILAVWLPDIAALIAGVWLLKRVSK